jgi:hypothetical protein
VIVEAERISDSCGYSVPRMDFVEHRSRLHDWTARQADEALADYQRTRNAASIDGLPGLA